MDPIAHTLAGATLAQTGLKKLTPLATATLVIGANLPDIDGVVSVLGSDAALYYRRGLTHGVVAWFVLPLVLTALMWAYDRYWRRRRHPEKEPVRVKGLLILSTIGVLSHPFLDWLNTYGVRLLMPFDGRWFYGDTLFILDPWMWLLMAAAVVFAHSRTRLSQAGWVVLGTLTSLVVTLTAAVPLAAKITWWVGVGVILLMRWRGVEASTNRRVAVGCVVAFCLYLAATMAGNQWAAGQVTDWLGEEHQVVVTDLMTGPVPANPFRRDVLAKTATHYHGLEVRMLGEERVRPLYEPVVIEEPGKVVQAALESEEIRGFVNWMRFPVYEVRAVEGGHQVVIRDLRYVNPDAEPGRGIGRAEVFVAHSVVED